MASVRNLLTAATTTETGAWVQLGGGDHVLSFSFLEVGTGALTGTVVIEVSNDGTNAQTLITSTLSGTTTVQDWADRTIKAGYVRARISALTGTGAAITVKMGI